MMCTRFAAVLICMLVTAGYPDARAEERALGDGEMLYVHVDKAFYMPGEILWFKVYAMGAQSHKPMHVSHVAYVEVLASDNASVLRAKIELGPDKPNSGSLYIPPGLSSGTYRFVAYTSMMKNLGPGRFFSKPITVLNPFEPIGHVRAVGPARAATDGMQGAESGSGAAAGEGLRLEAVLDKRQIGPRDQVNLSLRAAAGSEPAVPDLSMAVYRIDALQGEPSDDIAGYLAAQTTAGGDAQVARRPSGALVEYKTHRIAIRYTDKRSDRPLVGKTAWLSIPGKYDRLYVGRTDDDGVARFHVSNVYGMEQLATKLATNEEADVTLLSPFYTEHPEATIGETRNFAGLDNEVLTHSINVQAENAYTRQVREQFFRPRIDSVAFFGVADRTYWLDDYTRFVIMEEVLREYVLEVGVRKRGTDFALRVLDQANGYFFSADPLILLDGIPISDANGIMAYDPLKIQRIDIVTGRYFHGPLAYEGIVSFHTYDGLLPDFTLDAFTTLLDYEGMQYEREFYVPAYDTPEQRGSRLPDMRNVLLWDPNVRLDGNGEVAVAITASDVPGRYVVVVQGMDLEGNRCSTKVYFEVL